MVIRIKTGGWCCRCITAAHDASSAAVFRSRCFDGVFAVIAACHSGQLPLPVAKNRPVLFMVKRTTLMDQSVGLLTFWRQRGQCNDRPVQAFGFRLCVHHSGAKKPPQYQNKQRPAPGKHGKSSHHTTPFKSTGLTRTLRGASVMHCTKKSNSLPEKQANQGGIEGKKQAPE